MDLQSFFQTYNALTISNLETLRVIYTDDIVFIDPAHELHGISNLHEYFHSLYQNINSIDFTFHHHISSGQEAFVQWDMKFSHASLKKGKEIKVPGVSYLHFSLDNRVCRHNDYFDLGTMLYEHIPLLGTVIRGIKRRLGT